MPKVGRELAPYLQIAAAIRDQITHGHLRPGDQVPSARQLEAEWDVSLPTAYKALHQLQTEGLVHGIVGTGTFVSGGESDTALLDRIEREMGVDRDDLRHMLDCDRCLVRLCR